MIHARGCSGHTACLRHSSLPRAPEPSTREECGELCLWACLLLKCYRLQLQEGPQASGVRLSSFDDIRLTTGAVIGPGAGSDTVVVTGSGLSVPAGKYVRTAPVPVGTLPSATTAGPGARLSVTDANVPAFGTVVAAGGAVFTSVIGDGSSWRVG
jgi:hypothetical protein